MKVLVGIGLALAALVLAILLFSPGSGEETAPENSALSVRPADAALPTERISRPESASAPPRAEIDEPQEASSTAVPPRTEERFRSREELDAHFGDLLEKSMTVGIDPNGIAEEILEFAEAAKLDPESVEALGTGTGDLKYFLAGLPGEMTGEFILDPNETARPSGSLTLFLKVRYAKPVWVVGSPRAIGNFSLHTELDENLQPLGFGLMVQANPSGQVALENGLDLSDPSQLRGIAYAETKEGKIVCHKFFHLGGGQGPEDLSLILGPMNLSESLKRRIQSLLLEMARSVKPKEYR